MQPSQRGPGNLPQGSGLVVRPSGGQFLQEPRSELVQAVLPTDSVVASQGKPGEGQKGQGDLMLAVKLLKRHTAVGWRALSMPACFNVYMPHREKDTNYHCHGVGAT